MQIDASFEPGFDALLGRGVLEEIRPESLPKHITRTIGELPTVNLMVLSCCDGHQFMHVAQQTHEICCVEVKKALGSNGATEDCVHWRSENGGPFVLSVPSLHVRHYKGKIDHVDRNVLASMSEGMSLKKLNVVLLIGHAQCAKVMGLFRSADEYCDEMMRAKERVMAELNLPNEQVIAWLQVYRQSGRHMYHVNRSRVMSGK